MKRNSFTPKMMRELAVARIPQLRDSLLATADFREGLASFMERRPARFQGK